MLFLRLPPPSVHRRRGGLEWDWIMAACYATIRPSSGSQPFVVQFFRMPCGFRAVQKFRADTLFDATIRGILRAAK
jgi:hypothetical protein